MYFYWGVKEALSDKEHLGMISSKNASFNYVEEWQEERNVNAKT